MNKPTKPVTLSIRTPVDLVALAASSLGFAPEESMVMITFGDLGFHARVDLPAPGDVDIAVQTLLAPARRHRVEKVVFVAFSADPATSRPFSRALMTAFEAEGMEVMEILHADGAVWRHQCDRTNDWPHPYDIGAHPFLVRAILAGEVPTRTRADLAATLASAPEQVAEVTAALRALDEGPAVADQVWALRRLDAGDPVPGATEQARMLRAISAIGCRDQVWARADRDSARELARFLTPLVVAAPPGLVAAVASLLAFCSWLDGNGALAWCAVDRALADDPDYTMATLLAQLLEAGVSPTEWPGRLTAGSRRTTA